MRIVLRVIVLLLVLGFFGWVQFSSPDGDPTLRVDTDKVKQDTSAIVEKSKDIAGSAKQKIEDATEK